MGHPSVLADEGLVGVSCCMRSKAWRVCLSLQSNCGWRQNCALNRSSKDCSASWLHQQLQSKLLQCALHGGAGSSCQSGFAKRNPIWQLHARYRFLSRASVQHAALLLLLVVQLQPAAGLFWQIWMHAERFTIQAAHEQHS